jgi:hypothetical protein
MQSSWLYRQRPALGAGLQVCRRGGGHHAARHRGQRGAHRRGHAQRRAGAGAGERRHRQERHAAQRGLHPRPGHPHRRQGRDQARRRGDPQGAAPAAGLRDGSEREWTMPAACPVCGQPLVRPPGEAATYCINNACPEQLVRAVEYFVGRGRWTSPALASSRRSCLWRAATSTTWPTSTTCPGSRFASWKATATSGSITCAPASRRASSAQSTGCSRRWASALSDRSWPRR